MVTEEWFLGRVLVQQRVEALRVPSDSLFLVIRKTRWFALELLSEVVGSLFQVYIGAETQSVRPPL